MGQTLEAALYLHVPFCRAKCPYCDFYSLPKALDKAPLYLKALKMEARLRAPELKKYRLVTFYAGGGTPSLLPPSFYEELFSFLAGLFPLEFKEVTLEANPEGLSLNQLKAYRSLGFNRLSLGAQSFQEKGLRALGRRHTVHEIEKAVELARRAGFENLSLDLIFAWPGQTLKDLEEELKKAVSFGPEHLSCYELTIEEGTPFGQLYAQGKLVLPEEETVVSMYSLIEDFLTASGYEHYEISNYAKPGWRCQHNLFYWQARPYLGLGPAAGSYLNGVRYKNIEDLEAYLTALLSGRLPPQEIERLSKEARFREAVILGLRLLEGVSRSRLFQEFGFDLKEYYGPVIEDLIKKGLLEWAGDFLKLSKKGLLLANQVLSYLV